MPARRPALIHPVKFELVQVDLATTPPKHAQFSEPTGRPKYTSPFLLDGQIRIGSHGAYRQRPQGSDPQFSGHVLVIPDDVARLYPDLKFHVGDRIVRIYVGTPAEETVDWHVLEFQPAMHYDGVPRGRKLMYRDIKSQARLST